LLRSGSLTVLALPLLGAFPFDLLQLPQKLGVLVVFLVVLAIVLAVVFRVALRIGVDVS
jgi:hypothetical protein